MEPKAKADPARALGSRLEITKSERSFICFATTASGMEPKRRPMVSPQCTSMRHRNQLYKPIIDQPRNRMQYMEHFNKRRDQAFVLSDGIRGSSSQISHGFRQ